MRKTGAGGLTHTNEPPRYPGRFTSRHNISFERALAETPRELSSAMLASNTSYRGAPLVLASY